MTREMTQVPCACVTTHNPTTCITFLFNHPALCSLTTLRCSHTYSPPISCAKVLTSSSLSRYPIYLHSGSGKRNLVYSAKTTGPIPSMPPVFTSASSACLSMTYLTSTECNYSFFVHFAECLGSTRLIRPSKSPFSLTICCLFVPMAPCKTKQPLEPSSSAAPATLGRPNAKASHRLNTCGLSQAQSKVIFLDPLCTSSLSLETYLLI